MAVNLNLDLRTILEVVGVLGLVIFGGVALDKDKAYFCEERKLAMNCDSLAKYYGMPNGKCVNEELGNKLCKSGWRPFSEIAATRIELPTAIEDDYTTSPDGKTCYIKGDLRRGVPCDSI